MGEWSPIQRYRVRPPTLQFEGLEAVAQRLYDLTERSDLRRVESDRFESESLPASSVLQGGSPKSHKILYIEQTARGRQISTMGWLGGAKRRLAQVGGRSAPGGSYDWNFSKVRRRHAWQSPGGLVTVGWLPRDRPEVWIMGKDGSEPRRIGYGVFPHWTSELTSPPWKTDLAY